MIQLYHCPSTAAMIPHIILHEIGAEHALIHVDKSAGEHRAAPYRRLNPNGLLPLLVEGDVTIYETAAIVMYLCENHDSTGMIPTDRAARAQFFKWLAWLSSTLQPALILYFYGERWMNDGNDTGAAELKLNAEKRIEDMLGIVDAEFARHGGPWLLGRGYSAVDPYLFTLCRWTRNFQRRPARKLPHLDPFLQRMLARPAVAKVLAAEGIAAPFV